MRTFTNLKRIPPRWRAVRKASTPLSSLIPLFFAARHDFAAKTERSYRDQFCQFSVWCETRPHPHNRAATLADLEPTMVEAFIGHRMKHGVRSGVAGSEHQAAKAAVALKSLASFLAVRLVWHDGYGGSCLKSVLIPQSDAERKRLSETDLSRVFAAVEQNSPFPERDRVVLFLLAGNGLREKELVTLQVEHYDRREGIVYVPARGTKGRRGYRKPRRLYLDETVRSELDCYLDEYRVGRDEPEAPLVSTRSGTPFTCNGLYEVLKRLQRQSGVRALCPHALRHYWAEHFDGDLLQLKEEGGWNSWRLVERYRHHSPRTARKSTLSGALALRPKRISPQQISVSGALRARARREAKTTAVIGETA